MSWLSSVLPRRPDLVEFQKLPKEENDVNLQNAFRVADEHLGLSQLLDVQGVHTKSVFVPLCAYKWWSIGSTLLRSYVFCPVPRTAGHWTYLSI